MIINKRSLIELFIFFIYGLYKNMTFIFFLTLCVLMMQLIFDNKQVVNIKTVLEFESIEYKFFIDN